MTNNLKTKFTIKFPENPAVHDDHRLVHPSVVVVVAVAPDEPVAAIVQLPDGWAGDSPSGLPTLIRAKTTTTRPSVEARRTAEGCRTSWWGCSARSPFCRDVAVVVVDDVVETVPETSSNHLQLLLAVWWANFLKIQSRIVNDVQTDKYSAFHRFGQTKFVYSGSTLSSSHFCNCPSFLEQDYSKNYSKIIIFLN